MALHAARCGPISLERWCFGEPRFGAQMRYVGGGPIVSCPSLPPHPPTPLLIFVPLGRVLRLAVANRIDRRPSGDRLVRQHGNAPVYPANKLKLPTHFSQFGPKLRLRKPTGL